MDERYGEFTRTASGRHWVFPRLLRFTIFLFMEFDIGAEHARLLRLTLPRFSFSPEIDISAEHVRLRRSTLPFCFFFFSRESDIGSEHARLLRVARPLWFIDFLNLFSFIEQSISAPSVLVHVI